MKTDIRDALLCTGGATVMVALAGLALDNDLILNIGLKAAGVTLLAYGSVAIGIAAANVVAVAQIMVTAVQKGAK